MTLSAPLYPLLSSSGTRAPTPTGSVSGSREVTCGGAGQSTAIMKATSGEWSGARREQNVLRATSSVASILPLSPREADHTLSSMLAAPCTSMKSARLLPGHDCLLACWGGGRELDGRR